MDYQAEVKKNLWHGRRKKTLAPEGRRLKMLSRLGRLKTTELCFDWSTFMVHNCHKQLLDDDYIHIQPSGKMQETNLMAHNKTAE